MQYDTIMRCFVDAAPYILGSSSVIYECGQFLNGMHQQCRSPVAAAVARCHDICVNGESAMSFEYPIVRRPS